MKTITKYVAKDGSEWDTESKAVDRESLYDSVAMIMSLAPKKPLDPDCKFANGGGFLQWKPSVFKSVRRGILEIASKHIDHKWITQSIDDETIHPSWAARIIGEYEGPIWDAWCRIQCIDNQFREWGQPYYAMNPDKGMQVEFSLK